jgi:hypothetical protein
MIAELVKKSIFGSYTIGFYNVPALTPITLGMASNRLKIVEPHLEQTHVSDFFPLSPVRSK